MIEIAFLKDYPETIPTLARWYSTQWPEYYAERTLTEIAQDFYSEANDNDLPIRLIAFAENELAGTITLRERALRELSEYCPGLGGLLVVGQYRGRGIGSELVRAGMNLAHEQGYERVYATTVAAAGILERLRWRRVQSVLHGGERLELYRYELGEFDQTQ